MALSSPIVTASKSNYINPRRRSRFSQSDLLQDFEKSIIYQLLHKATGKSFNEAIAKIKLLQPAVLRLKSHTTGNTYFHELVLVINRLHDHNNEDLKPAIIFLYQLSLYGAEINIQNEMGHTPLHLACFRPHGSELALHLLRIGCDPCLEDNQGYRIFVDLSSGVHCYLVRNQPNIYCSIWQAVQKEDFEMIDRFMRCWFRVNTKRKRKSMLDVAYDTSNYEVVDKLQQYESTNELVAVCFANDSEQLERFIQMRFDKPNFQTEDHSFEIAKPLLVAIEELLPYSQDVYERLCSVIDYNPQIYKDMYSSYINSYCTSEFYLCLQTPDIQSIDQAWDLLDRNKVPLNDESDTGDNYLHYLVRKYCEIKDLVMQRAFIRLIHKLALTNLDFNHRNHDGETALNTAYRLDADRRFLDYLINLGIDCSYRDRQGSCLSINAYATRDQIILSEHCQRRSLPGLWPAVEDRDMARVKQSLRSLCRVNTVKAGRNPLQYARDSNCDELVELLSRFYYHTEFVVAALAADIYRMKFCLAMGQGSSKVNAVYNNFYAGLTNDWKIEIVVRPILVSVMEICTPLVVQKFIKYGVNLGMHYEEIAPCAPIAFWAFRDDINEEISFVVAQHADLTMRDELGSTLLHKAIIRTGSKEGKAKLLQVLLDRDANVAARDFNRKTARDYCDDQNVQHGAMLRQIIDDHVLNLVYEENYDAIEDLIIQGYDHITDICGTIRNKTALDLAQLRYSKELIELLSVIDRYQHEIRLLLAAVVQGDSRACTRLLSEKKVAWGVDKRQRNILHLAVLYRHSELVSLICDQFPQLINQEDAIQRTPIHYAVSLRDQRQTLSIISSSNTINLQRREANDMSSLDYIKELEHPTPRKLKSVGRRVYNYDVRNLVEIEKRHAEEEFADLLQLSRSPIQSCGSIEHNTEGTFVTNISVRAHTAI